MNRCIVDWRISLERRRGEGDRAIGALERRDLFALMDEQPGIAIGICQTLARHARGSIRRLEEKLAEKD